MAKIKYYYDTKTCRYERVKTTKMDTILNGAGILAMALMLGAGLSWAYIEFFPSTQVTRLQQEKKQIELKYNVLNEEVAQASEMLEVLQKRDDNLYRSILEADPIPNEVRKGGTGGAAQMKALLDERLERQDLVLATAEKIERLKHELYVQALSYDELADLARKKKEMVAAMPAIQPISSKATGRRIASGFGMRMHPILKTRRLHAGLDFSAPRGTDVHATGNGKVIKAGWSGGYGKLIEIDHGHNYRTRYAHLSKMLVRKGQKVKRGQVIGKVGNTGLSVSSHLHYEVYHKGKPVNPVNYFFADVTPEEYQQILEAAARDTQSLGGTAPESGGK